MEVPTTGLVGWLVGHETLEGFGQKGEEKRPIQRRFRVFLMFCRRFFFF